MNQSNATIELRPSYSPPRPTSSWRTRILWALDRLFPPMPSAYMESAQQTTHEVAKASESMGQYLAELDSTDVDVLDFGCGWGGEAFWLAERVRSVVGADIDPQSVADANRALAARQITNCRFVLGTQTLRDASFDAVFSTDTFEHVADLPSVFRELFRVLRPGGVVISRWGPLFYSPFGYHLRWACQVPYGHVIGGLRGVCELRQARSPKHPAPVQTWAALGLNGRVFADYREAAQQAGFRLARFDALPVKGLTSLTKVPWLSRFFIFGVSARLEKPRD